MIIYNSNANNVKQTLQLANLFVQECLLNRFNLNKQCVVIYLIGDLGVGKTTFMRGLVSSCGFKGAVKSPTYTIVEPYLDLINPMIHLYHFDLYRLDQPSDLEMIGIRDYLKAGTICCFEWPDKGVGHIPQPNFIVRISIINKHIRSICISKAYEAN